MEQALRNQGRQSQRETRKKSTELQGEIDAQTKVVKKLKEAKVKGCRYAVAKDKLGALWSKKLGLEKVLVNQRNVELVVEEMAKEKNMTEEQARQLGVDFDRELRTPLEKMDPETPLSSLGPEQLNVVILLACTMRQIPKTSVPIVREAFNKVLGNLVKASKDKKATIQDLKSSVMQYKLLPLVLLSTAGCGKGHGGSLDNNRCKALVKKRAQLVLDNEWDTFKIKDFQWATYNEMVHQMCEDDGDIISKELMAKHNVHQRVTQLLKDYETSKAMALLQRGTAPKCGVDENVVAKLQDVSPAKGDPELTELESKILRDARASSRLGERQSVGIDDVVNLRALTRNHVAAGITGLRPEHLAAIFGLHEKDKPKEGLNGAVLYAELMEIMLNGEGPDALWETTNALSLLAISKADGTPRPIGLQDLDKKLVSGIAKHRALDEAKDIFGSKQVALMSGGMEVIIHKLRAIMSLNEEFDIFLGDGKNAFGKVSRDRMMLQVHKHFPWMFKMVDKIYGEKPTLGFVKGDSNQLFQVDIEEGVTQGDVLGVFLFCLTIMPFLEGISDILESERKVAPADDSNPLDSTAEAYVDDISSATKFSTMCKVIQFMIDDGPKHGYTLRRDKGVYLLGKCTTNADAIIRKKYLVRTFKFKEDMIRIHPANGGEANLYGASVLGGFIGTDEFILVQLGNKLDKLSDVADKLVEYNDPHCKYTLFRKSFQTMFNHLLRTTSPRLLQDSFGRLDEMNAKIMLSIIGEKYLSVDNSVWKDIELQVQMKTADGGLGLGKVEKISRPAYLASLAAASQHIQPELLKMLKAEDIDDVVGKQQPQLVVDFREATAVMKATIEESEFYPQEALDEITSFNEWFLGMAKGDHNCKDKNVQAYLSSFVYMNTKREFVKTLEEGSVERLAWYTSVMHETATIWLDTHPNKIHYYLDPARCIIAFRRLLRLDLLEIVAGAECTCGKKDKPTPVDRKGDHFTVVCGQGGQRIKTHDAIRDGLCAMCRQAGLVVRSEPSHLLRDNGKRPDALIEGLRAQTLLIDVTVTGSVSHAKKQQSRSSARTPFYMAGKATNVKVRKYDMDCDKEGLLFEPFVVEGSGSLPEMSVKFLTELANKAQYKMKLPPGVIFKSFLRRISFIIQTAMADSILSRTGAKDSTDDDPAFRHECTQNRLEAVLDCQDSRIDTTFNPVFQPTKKLYSENRKGLVTKTMVVPTKDERHKKVGRWPSKLEPAKECVTTHLPIDVVAGNVASTSAYSTKKKKKRGLPLPTKKAGEVTVSC